VRIGPTAWPFTGFIHTYIHTDRQLDKYILDKWHVLPALFVWLVPLGAAIKMPLEEAVLVTST
jgi:hypothetical protein